ncbi:MULTISPECIES: type II toxin-antitoxin system RelE/ParE family toxin [Bacteroides]|uniref:type II toxin-antitoxin system RelE/ParE family toxin n=1 Tax=Bacteroides TaxID=816 RepID=UPI001C37A816|nr:MULTISPECIES: type II toxin-antitoxin system RelE/ParE family toxin [Bacteroides]MBD8980688.1 type II toxin-antitoxin system RelE/ParE family toxin [Bacteroides cellulosilyticus]MBD8981309.1 type II toxin-antitoxin system RelE/ParE family toxin [Bacteroides cellulosilyticus]MBV3638586.1 type II toxin-antitoxin system RelE/ParE family toxin [Bacteroides cellulosilyticus]MBV3664253.1 type II toxin-antitoxin system RelE/ParE family toxin [Bacteroides cellulosilyticus]MBV3686154.1 type II toxin
MEAKERFKVVYSAGAKEFLQRITSKAREKIISNARKASYTIDPKLFKKLTGTDLWEFRTLYDGKQYRLLAFWDKTKEVDTLVIASHGFIKKTDKTPIKEIERASKIMKEYFELK